MVKGHRKNFYQGLFTEKGSQRPFFLELNINLLDQDSISNLERDFSEEEVC